MRLQLLHAHGNAPFAGIICDLEHYGFDLLPHGEHIRGLLDAAPRDVTHMEQGIHSTQIHESAVVGEATDRTGESVAWLHLGIATVLHRAFFLFGDSATIHYDVFLRYVELDDAAENLLLDHFPHFSGVARPAAGGGHERAHAHVHTEPAFDHASYRADDSRFVRESLFQCRPVFGPLNLGSRELVVAFGIAPLHRDWHLVAGLHRFSTAALQGRQGENAFAFETDVEEDRVTGDDNYCAHELLAAVFALARMALLVLRKHVAEGLSGFGDRFLSEFGFWNAGVGHDEFGNRKIVKRIW